MSPLPEPTEPELSPSASANDSTTPPDWIGLIFSHLLLFGFAGPIVGMFCLPLILLFTAGPSDALMMTAILFFGLIMGIGLVYAFHAGAVPALIVGLLVALLHLRGASERTLYFASAGLGIVCTSIWLVIVPNLDLPTPAADFHGRAYIFISALGALSALAMTYLSRRFRRPKGGTEQAILDQF
jgi:hypothetical protein